MTKTAIILAASLLSLSSNLFAESAMRFAPDNIADSAAGNPTNTTLGATQTGAGVNAATGTGSGLIAPSPNLNPAQTLTIGSAVASSSQSSNSSDTGVTPPMGNSPLAAPSKPVDNTVITASGAKDAFLVLNGQAAPISDGDKISGDASILTRPAGQLTLTSNVAQIQVGSNTLINLNDNGFSMARGDVSITNVGKDPINVQTPKGTLSITDGSATLSASADRKNLAIIVDSGTSVFTDKSNNLINVASSSLTIIDDLSKLNPLPDNYKIPSISDDPFKDLFKRAQALRDGSILDITDSAPKHLTPPPVITPQLPILELIVVSPNGEGNI